MDKGFLHLVFPGLKDFDPNQPRDESGKWSDTGSDGSSESKVNRKINTGAKKVSDEIDKLTRTGGHNVRIYAERAFQAIVNAYVPDPRNPDQMITRSDATPEQIDKADKLIAMGSVNAVYGKGRSLLGK